MKKNLSTLLLTAVGMTLSAAAAYGQGPMRADVPFQFHTTNTTLIAGKYSIAPAPKGNAQVIQITNLDSRRTSFVLANQSATEASGRARLVFRCGDVSGCALVEAYTGSGQGWKLSPPRAPKEEKQYVAVIFLHRNDAD